MEDDTREISTTLQETILRQKQRQQIQPRSTEPRINRFLMENHADNLLQQQQQQQHGQQQQQPFSSEPRRNAKQHGHGHGQQQIFSSEPRRKFVNEESKKPGTIDCILDTCALCYVRFLYLPILLCFVIVSMSFRPSFFPGVY